VCAVKDVNHGFLSLEMKTLFLFGLINQLACSFPFKWPTDEPRKETLH
jgi:hypothetical protein